MAATDQSRYLSFIEKMAGLLLLSYPTLMLAVKGGMNGAFLAMLLLVVAVWIARPNGLAPTAWKKEWTIYAASMAAMSVAVFISQSYHQNYSASPYDGPSRYWLAIPVFLLLRRLDLRVIAMLQFAFPFAAIAGLLLAGRGEGRTGIDTLDLIHFGDFELILAALSLFSVDWLGRDKMPLRILKILGCAAGAAASFGSGSRGGWLAIPVFVLIYIYFTKGSLAPRKILAIVAAALVAGALLYSINSSVHQRVNDVRADIAAFDQGNRDTSTGIRWQLYKAALDIFSRNPLFGVGLGGFAAEMTPMMQAGKITPVAAELGRGEVHNDILCKAAGMGIFGLAAILAVYLVPLWLFWRAAKSASAKIKRGGTLGIVFVSGFFVFGLTVETLNLTMAIAFYSFTVAALLAACYNTHHNEQVTTL